MHCKIKGKQFRNVFLSVPKEEITRFCSLVALDSMVPNVPKTYCSCKHQNICLCLHDCNVGIVGEALYIPAEICLTT